MDGGPGPGMEGGVRMLDVCRGVTVAAGAGGAAATTPSRPPAAGGGA